MGAQRRVRGEKGARPVGILNFELLREGTPVVCRVPLRARHAHLKKTPAFAQQNVPVNHGAPQFGECGHLVDHERRLPARGALRIGLQVRRRTVVVELPDKRVAANLSPLRLAVRLGPRRGRRGLRVRFQESGTRIGVWLGGELRAFALLLRIALVQQHLVLLFSLDALRYLGRRRRDGRWHRLSFCEISYVKRDPRHGLSAFFPWPSSVR